MKSNIEILRGKIFNNFNNTDFKYHIEDIKTSNKTIVFTNGCFDLLHRGHIDYLSRAADLGDYLIVGLNTDSSVSTLKGPSRPIQDQDSRAEIIASLGFVDFVVLFDEETPLELIEYVVPNILVKGADYDIKDIIGADCVLKNGGKVVTIPFLDGYSTSKIVNKIKTEK